MNNKMSPSTATTVRAFRSLRQSLFLLPAVALAMTGNALAGTDTWNGTSGVDWNTPADWTPNGLPASGDTALFNSGAITTPITVTNTSNETITSINFDTAAGSYTIGTTGGGQLQVQNGGTTQILSTLTTTGAVETINAPIDLAGANNAYTFANNSADANGTLNIGGAVSGDTAGADVLTLSGSNTNLNNISGAISNGSATSVAVTKTGTGTWELSGANTYSGATTLTSGTLAVAGAGALSANTSLTMAPGSTLQLLSNSSATFAPQSFETSGTGTYNIFVGNNGSGTGNTLSLYNVGAANVLSSGINSAQGASATFQISSANGYNLSLANGATGGSPVTTDAADAFYNNTPGTTVFAPSGFYAGGYGLTLGGVGNWTIASFNQATTASLTYNGQGSGTLTINGNAQSAFVAAGSNDIINLQGGTLVLDNSNYAAGNLLSGAPTLNVYGGNFTVKGNAALTDNETFTATNANAGANVFTVSGSNPTLTLGNFVQNLGASVEFVGPATIGLNNVAVASTGTITDNYIGTGNNSTTTAGAGTKGLLWNGTTRQGIATVGLYDWASTDTTTGTAGTSPYTIIGGSQVSGFYTTAASGTIVNGDTNVDITGNVTGAPNGYNDTLRFNTNATVTLSLTAGSASNKGYTVGGILVTPNVGQNNTTIAYATTTTNTWLAGPNGYNATGKYNPLEIVQNNTQGELIITAAIYNDLYAPNSPLDYVQSGPGTVVMTANGANNNFTGTNDYLNGGVTEIATDNALGNFTTNGNTGANLNINGGTVLASTTLAMDGGTTVKARKSFLGGNGGGFAAVTGATLTVDGVIANSANGTGPLVIGIPASTANGSTVGLVPGTGTGTANATAVLANGAVKLTGANTYSGGTTVAGGTLLANSTGATGTGVVNVQSGAALGGSGTIAPSGVTTGVAVNIAAGGLLQPSAVIGTPTTLTFNLSTNTSLNLATGAQLGFYLGTTSDLVNISNGLLSLNGQNFSDFAFTAGTGFTTGTYTLFSTSAPGDVTGLLGGSTSGTVGGDSATLVIDANGQNVDLVVSSAVVPEPSTWALMLGGLSLLVLRQIRQRRN